MRIAPLTFRDFETGQSGTLVAGRRGHLPGGRRKEEAPPPPPAPTFSEEELKTAEREGYKKGFLEGTEDGRKQAETEQAAVDRALTETVERFARSVAPLLDDYRNTIQQVHEDLPKVALAIAKKVAGSALTENAPAVVTEVATACAEMMIQEPKLTITVHTSVADTLEKKLQELVAKVQSTTQLVVVRDEAIAAADCRIEWKYGAMERHTGQLWQEVERVVEAMAASARRTTDTQIEQLEQPSPEQPPLEQQSSLEQSPPEQPSPEQQLPKE